MSVEERRMPLFVWVILIVGGLGAVAAVWGRLAEADAQGDLVTTIEQRNEFLEDEVERLEREVAVQQRQHRARNELAHECQITYLEAIIGAAVRNEPIPLARPASCPTPFSAAELDALQRGLPLEGE